jgi:hypothetical protein
MRAARWLVVLALAAPLALVTPAIADGGAYIELDRTFYLAGSTARAEAYVSVPIADQDVLERGPFHLYILPEGSWLEERRRLPRQAIRVGTFALEEYAPKSFELTASFTVPDLPTARYSVQVCNDPCTVAGFREPLTGLLTIATTPVEASLLERTSSMEWWVASLRDRVSRLRDEREELEAALQVAFDDRNALRAELSDLSSPPPAASPLVAPATEADRSLVDPWALLALGGAVVVGIVAIALALVFSRRRVERFVVPDTITELDDLAEELSSR